MDLTTFQLEATGAMAEGAVLREPGRGSIEIVTMDRFGVVRPVNSVEYDGQRDRLIIHVGSLVESEAPAARADVRFNRGGKR